VPPHKHLRLPTRTFHVKIACLAVGNRRMINAKCQCGGELVVGEDAINNVYACPSCGRALRLVCAEQLGEGAGAGDFDARLTIAAGPSRVGEIIFLGGVMELEVGKLPGKHILLEANMVSRFHCKFVRIDFGPSRWKIVDNKSTNGLFVNRQRIAEHELQNGDQINIGGYQLEYSIAGEAVGGEEPIDLGAMEEADAGEAIEAEPLEAEPVEEALEAQPVDDEGVTTAAPARVKKKKLKPAKLSYARGGSTGFDVRLLGDSDPEWVKKIRLASNLLLLSVVLNFLSGVSDKFASELVGLLLGVGSTVVNLLGAWFLTEPEPDTPESGGQTVLRVALRIVSVITAGGAISVAMGSLMENPLMLLGGFALLAAIPQFFLFLLYLRILVKRIPNDSLAMECMIVMIGLPSCIVLIAISAMQGAMTRSASIGLSGICVGVCGTLIFALWYLSILIRFQKDLN
jgi:hypothetical protein